MVAYDPNDSGVNLRAQPDGEVIGNLNNLALLQMQGPAGALPGWNWVYSGSLDEWGYVWGDLLRRELYQVQDPVDPSVNLRQSPNGNVITALSNGTLVRFLGIEEDWTLVATENDQQGYVHTDRMESPNCF